MKNHDESNRRTCDDEKHNYTKKIINVKNSKGIIIIKIRMVINLIKQNVLNEISCLKLFEIINEPK